MARLENWYFEDRGHVIGQQGSIHLHGDIHGHERFKNGAAITTSKLVAYEGDVVITKNGSRYELGAPDSKLYDDAEEAKNTLFEAIDVSNRPQPRPEEPGL